MLNVERVVVALIMAIDSPLSVTVPADRVRLPLLFSGTLLNARWVILNSFAVFEIHSIKSLFNWLKRWKRKPRRRIELTSLRWIDFRAEFVNLRIALNGFMKLPNQVGQKLRH